ncbi:unnamed protein product [Allacma fusca]|uniref:Uncharacterized protein n=1 Tax=Allacma fusca TaxID=39272 RepID=A0A8J2KBS6_9HEXA|nr:unnamed protein product [Allacma fusca]
MTYPPPKVSILAGFQGDPHKLQTQFSNYLAENEKDVLKPRTPVRKLNFTPDHTDTPFPKNGIFTNYEPVCNAP